MAGCRKHRSHWHGDLKFLKMMAEEIEKTYTPGTTFRKESQLHVNRKFRAGAAHGNIYSDRFLKSRFKALKYRYRVFSKLLSHEGTYWNRQYNILYGNNPLLAQNYEYCDRIRGYRGGEENFELMCEVFERGVHFEI